MLKALKSAPHLNDNLRLLSYTRALESPHPEKGSGFHSCFNTPCLYHKYETAATGDAVPGYAPSPAWRHSNFRQRGSWYYSNRS